LHPARRRRRLTRRTRIVSIFRPEGMPADILPRVRKDALPDDARYPDTGCELARTCLACPLPRCQYDEPDSIRRWLAEARDREIAVLRRRYRAPVSLLCATYGLTRRSVYRIFVEQGVRTTRRAHERHTPLNVTSTARTVARTRTDRSLDLSSMAPRRSREQVPVRTGL
jgi:hypothetical protein